MLRFKMELSTIKTKKKGKSMYLAILTKEEQKLFLELAHHMANVDDDFSSEEAQLTELFRKESNLSEIEYPLQHTPLETIFEKLKRSVKINQRMIFIEILGLVFADNTLHEKENELLGKLRELFSVSEAQEKQVKNALTELSEAYRKLGAFVTA